ncbi:hypothetical protein [Fodinibius halophilus]|uniref:Uncharacterized protein n=1 Tax=Fodinibius halophilus TaxID=1736908 RepID=A0A6M1T725_9BACT|nr:hypothetical protein [Fodinibius halophilus]NGP88453.1 hypothetical protein [Fodinibius halophilus]
MTAQHMIEHLIFSFQISTDKRNVECHTPKEKRAKLQAFLATNRPMPKKFTNPVTGDQLLPLQHEDSKQAKEHLKNEVEHYRTYFRNNPEAIQTNPYLAR